MKVVFYANTNGRGRRICEAVVQGCARHGLRAGVTPVQHYHRPEADVAVFYGLWPPLKQIQADYVAAGRKSVLIDLGYWNRTEGGKLEGYHRIAVNGLHATAYFQHRRHDASRFRRLGVEVRPMRSSHEPRATSHVLLCGMSAKSAWVYDLEPQQWECAAVEELRRHTAREIHYRPKQSWQQARPIEDTTWAKDNGLLGPGQLSGCWAVVTHHGNSALDALVNGVPAFATAGLASVLAGRDLAAIESPLYPSDQQRDQLLFDAAWTQWKMGEIADGSAWQYLMDERLIQD